MQDSWPRPLPHFQLCSVSLWCYCKIMDAAQQRESPRRGGLFLPDWFVGEQLSSLNGT